MSVSLTGHGLLLLVGVLNLKFPISQKIEQEILSRLSVELNLALFSTARLKDEKCDEKIQKMRWFKSQK